MGIRKLIQTKQQDDGVTTPSTTNNNETPKFILQTAFHQNHSNKEFIRRTPQRSSSNMSEDSRCSYSSSSSSQSSISFSDTVEVQEITPMFALTDTPEDLWYQQAEYTNIHKRIRQLARYIETQDDDDEDAYIQSPKKKVCTRGLEWMMDGRCKRRQDARKCVLTAQRLQFDDEGMALAYESVTHESVVVAQERASNDAKAIETYLRR